MDLKAIAEGFILFSAEEREVLLDAVEGRETSPKAIAARLTVARRRTRQRRASDAGTDVSRRVLVGARIPRETAQRYRACAAGNGMSLYRFACSALEREYDRLSTIPGADVERE